MIPAAQWPLDEAVVHGLLARHLPHLAHLPLGRRFEGWDNVTWRLGDDLALRLPRITAAEDLLLREQRWVPELSAGWPFAVPLPEYVGRPDDAFPHAWSVLRWVDGDDAATSPLGATAARPLAAVLAAIHRPAPPEAPDTPWRTASLAEREPELREALAGAALDGLDRVGVEQLWADARELPTPRHTWVHADLHAANVISRDGLPVGVVDWGEVCAGDPAIDVAMVWPLLPDLEAVHTCLAAYGAEDDELLARARAHALLACAVHATGDQPRIAEAGRRGLRLLGVLDDAE